MTEYKMRFPEKWKLMVRTHYRHKLIHEVYKTLWICLSSKHIFLTFLSSKNLADLLWNLSFCLWTYYNMENFHHMLFQCLPYWSSWKAKDTGQILLFILASDSFSVLQYQLILIQGWGLNGNPPETNVSSEFSFIKSH